MDSEFQLEATTPGSSFVLLVRHSNTKTFCESASNMKDATIPFEIFQNIPHSERTVHSTHPRPAVRSQRGRVLDATVFDKLAAAGMGLERHKPQSADGTGLGRHGFAVPFVGLPRLAALRDRLPIRPSSGPSAVVGNMSTAEQAVVHS